MTVRSLNILIAALGGEGGGVLADWIVAAATIAGYPIQSTSVPGVAQRTGATTYYLELFPQKLTDLGDKRPILALTPTPGDLDIVIASELVEAGRAMQNGYVAPERTTLIASTSRVYAIGERAAMADGRFDSERIIDAARTLSRRAVLFDGAELTRSSGYPINAILFGALTASQALPFDRAVAEVAIRQAGKAADSNLRGFALGFAQGDRPHVVSETEVGSSAASRPSLSVADFPPQAQEIIAHGVERLTDYQGQAYARVYLDRLHGIAHAETSAGLASFEVTRETGRYLALWMSYEDVIRVADLKTRAQRRDRIRKEVNAGSTDIVRVADFLKPGLEELCSILPANAGRRLYEFGVARGWQRKLNVGMHIRSTNVGGFLLLRFLGSLRWWRPYSWRFREEQSRIEHWLAAIVNALPRDPALALEIANCGQLMKGYGDTYARAVRNFGLIAKAYFGGALEARQAAAAIAAARNAALADPEGDALTEAIARSSVTANRPFAAAAE